MKNNISNIRKLNEQPENAVKMVLVRLIMIAFFAITIVEISAEFFENKWLIYCSKPLLMPVLFLLYILTSKMRNPIYMLALVFVWLGNIFLITKSLNNLIIGTVFFTIFRILIIYHLLRTVRLPGVLPMVIGSMPFLFLYILAMHLAHDELGANFYTFAIQGVFPVIFGGISLGAYVFKPSKSNTFLIISMIFFTCTQFLFVIKYFYVSLNIFQSILMLLFCIAHFALYKSIVTEDQVRYKKRSLNLESL